MKTFRIFISSPGDVAVERDKARKVVENLQKRYTGRLRLETVLWEDLPLGAVDSFQGGIDVVLAGANAIDIAVFILWSRLGSPLGATIRKPDGSLYRSGTEREFDLMLSARAQSSDQRPEILVYVRQDDRRFKAALQDKPTDEIEDMLRQHRLAEQFIREQFQDAETGVNLRAYHTFPDPNSFAERLKAHLRNLLDAIAFDGGLNVGTWEGSPYRGLEVFRSEHAPIFFGRDEEVCEALERLRAQAEAGCAFLLLVGASGSGKSSLARAGILPALASDNPDESVAKWHTAAFTPAACADGLCRELARILLDHLPGLRGDEQSLEDLEQALRDGQGKALSLLLRRACAGTSGRDPVRLVLLIDQLEELFTHSGITESETVVFLAALQALAVSGSVWVLATVRSDFYGRCQQFPALMSMKGDRGQMDLLPPKPSDIHRIIAGPAVLAGVGFEKNASGESLDQRLLNDAVGHPEALPLLEFALAQLYDTRTAEGLLTFAAYEKLGGVEGAVGCHAEAVFAAQPEPVRAAFDPVFGALVALDENDEARPVRRRVALDALAATPERRQLVEALLAVRLLSSDRGEVFVAHEALLRRWGRAVQWIDANREFLRVRDRVAARIREGGRLLDGDPLLGVAHYQLATMPAGFTPEQRTFIEVSVTEVARKQQRERRIRNSVVVGLSALTLVALATMVWAIAERNKTRDTNRKNLEILRSASDADFATAQKIWTEGFDAQQNGERSTGFNGKFRWHESVALLIRSLLRDSLNQSAAISLYDTIRRQGHARKDWPAAIIHQSFVKCAGFNSDGTHVITVDGETARIWDATTGKPVGGPLRFGCNIYGAMFSPDGTHVITGDGETARIWDVSAGKPVGEPLRHDKYAYLRLDKTAFSPDGARVITVDYSTARIWDVSTGKPVGEPMRTKGQIESSVFSSNGARIVTVDDKTARIWDVSTSKPVGEPLWDEDVFLLDKTAFSPDGTRVITVNYRTARIWDVATGKPVGRSLRHGGYVNSSTFSPDDVRVVIVGVESTQIWDVSTGKPVGEPMRQERGKTESVTFSSDGMRVITVDGNTARIWDASTGKPVGEPLRHEQHVQSAAFSPDGSHIVTTAEDDSVSIWGTVTGKPVCELLRHETSVQSAAFNSDGSRIVTVGNCRVMRSDTYNVQVWNASTGKFVGEPLWCERSANSAEFSPDGTRVITVDCETAQIWDASTGKHIGEPLRHKRYIKSVAFSLDGTRVVTASDDATAQIWDASTGKPIGEPLRHEKGVNSAAFSPDGTRVITAGGEAMIAQVWNTATGRPIGEPLRHEMIVESAAFSPNGMRIITKDYKTAQVWDVATGRPVGKPMRHEKHVYSAAFSPDGARVITVCDKTAQVWDAAAGKPVGELLRHNREVRSAAFSLDGARVVTASDDSTARVWDAFTGKPIGEPLRHEKGVNSAAFSPDGMCVVTASDDATVRVWDAPVLSVPLTKEVLAWASGVAGLRFDQNGELQEIPNVERLKLIQAIDALPDVWRELARWLLNSGPDSLFSPTSRFTVRQIAERERNSLFRDGIESSLQCDPTVPFARTLLAEAWLNEYKAKSESERDGSLLRRAIFMCNYDMKKSGSFMAFYDALSSQPEKLRASVINALVDFDCARGDYASASTNASKLVDLRRKICQSNELANALAYQGVIDFQINRYKESYEALSESLRVRPPWSPQRSCDLHNLLCWAALLIGKDDDAMIAGEIAVYWLKDDKPCPARMNLAHAYLFNGQFEEAQAIYATYCGTVFEDGRKWNDEVRNDFKTLLAAGRDCPDMKKIEALLDAKGVAP